MKVLIIGATGMLGYSLFSNLSTYSQIDVFGTVRSLKDKEHFYKDKLDKLFFDIDVHNIDTIETVISHVKPNIVINCIGLIKQHGISKQHIDAISINSLLPHQIANICDLNDAKLIHFSTDCVFSGNTGAYIENDVPDAEDLYGKTKFLGEVSYAPHLTLRTSIIGHELTSQVSLIDWFLSQNGQTKGFSKAIFSGLPTCFVAKLIAEHILPKHDLSGLYHLSVDPIDKFTLLKLVADIYNKKIDIEESSDLVIDRSLNSERIKQELGFDTPSWHSLISDMHNDFKVKYEGLKCKS